MKRPLTLLCCLTLLPVLGCEHPKPFTLQDLESNPSYVRTSTHDIEAKAAYDRVAELAMLCWDDSNQPTGEKVLETTGLVIAAILLGPTAGTLRTRRVTTAQFNPETRGGIVMMRTLNSGPGNLGAIVETKPKDKGTELRVMLKGQPEPLHAIAQRWVRGERVCTGLTNREVK